MKHLFTLFAFSIFIQNVHAQMSVPQCTVLSIDHFGGNLIETIGYGGIISNPNGSFSIPIGTNSDSSSGDFLTACTQAVGGGGVFRTYDADYTSLISQSCAPVGTHFAGPTFYVFPQSNGDTILIGQSDLNYGDFGIECRDASGIVLWTKHYGGSGDERFVYAVPAKDGGFFLLGESHSDDGDVGLHYGSYFIADIWVLKVDNDGNKVWSKVIGGTLEEIASMCVAADDGGLYVFGSTSSDDHDAADMQGGADLYIVKLDSAGAISWHKCLGGSGTDAASYDRNVRAIKDGNHGFYVLSFTESTDGDVQQRMPDGADLWLLHIDSLGNILWENTYGGPGSQYPFSLCRATDGSLWMGGYFLGNTVPGGEIDATYGGNDGWVVHADSMGNFINQVVLGADKAEYVDALHPLPDGTVLACGRYEQYGTPGSGSFEFPSENQGFIDIFLARLGPQTEGINERTILPDTWELFPNPGHQAVTVRVKNKDDKYQVHITDASGKKIYRHRFRRQLTINTTGWGPGIYIVQLIDRSGKTGTQKLIIK
ncbi:MAG TPA: T9SS type A sorting domain-containing protein [Edaphocola sp.]|nr:T9SS type A sorting domain-containing protein [Edaphocola sp.]